MPNFYWVGGWTGNTGFNSGYSSGSGIWTSVINGATSASGDYAFGPYYWGFWQNWRVQGPSNILLAALTGGQSGSVSSPGQPGVTGWLPSGPRSGSGNIGDSVYFGYPNFVTTTSYLSSQIVENFGGGGVGFQNRGIACLFGGLNPNDQWLGASGQGRTGQISRIEITQWGCTSGETHQLDGVYPDYILDGGLTGMGFTSGPAGYGMYRNSRLGLFRVNQIGFDVGDDAEQALNTNIPTGFTADSLKRIPLAIISGLLVSKNNNLVKIIIRSVSTTGGSKLSVESDYSAGQSSPFFRNTRFANIAELHLLGGTAAYISNRNGTKLNVDQFTIYNGSTPFTYRTSVDNIQQDSSSFGINPIGSGTTSGDAGIVVNRDVSIRNGITINPSIIRSAESGNFIENYSDGQTVYRIGSSCPSINVHGGKFYLGNAGVSGEGGGICVPSIVDNNSTIQFGGVKNGVHIELGSDDGITSSYGNITINDTNHGVVDPAVYNSLGMNPQSGPTGNGRRSNVILKLKHVDIATLNANKGHILPSFESDESSIIRIADGYLKSDAWLSTIYPFSESYQGFQLGLSADASGNASDGIRVDSYDVRVNFAKGTNVKINTTAVGPT